MKDSTCYTFFIKSIYTFFAVCISVNALNLNITSNWSCRVFAIHFVLRKSDNYLYDLQFTIRTDPKPLKYILEYPVQNKKIQLLALSITGYNCKIKYIEGRFNCMMNQMLKTFFEVNVLDSNAFSPKRLTKCEVKQHDELIKSFIDLPEEVNIKKKVNKTMFRSII